MAEQPAAKRDEKKYSSYFLAVPLIIYPYAYLTYLFYISPFASFVSDKAHIPLDFYLFLAAFVLYHGFILFFCIRNIRAAAKSELSARGAAVMNLLVKGLHIPAYIFHFIIGTLGIFMSVWGIGVILFAVLTDVMTIALSGLNAVSCAVCFKKEKRMSMFMCVFTSVCSFIFCIDVIIAVVWFVKSKPHTAAPPAAQPVITDIKSESEV